MYKLTNSNYIIRLLDNACIPMDSGNRDYRDYLRWLDDGNIATPADQIPEKTAEEKRCDQYKKRADPYLIAYVGYQIEVDNGDQSAISKRDKAKSDYISIKNQIRQEIV